MNTTGAHSTDASAGNGYEKMPELEVDSERFDQPPWHKKYIICTTPRCGSHLLCRQLINAGLGVPHEYYNTIHANLLCRRWNVNPWNLQGYTRCLYAKRTTPNGVWGTKLHWNQYDFACRTYQNAKDLFDQEILEGSVYIFLRRKDFAAQAVSYHISTVTGVWDFDGAKLTDEGSTLTLGDLAHVELCAQGLRWQTDEWNNFFTSRGIVPINIFFEDYVRDQPGNLVRVAQFLGLGATQYRVPPPEAREVPFSPDIEAMRGDLIGRYRAQCEANRPDGGAKSGG